jgi:hypothetical protein
MSRWTFERVGSSLHYLMLLINSERTHLKDFTQSLTKPTSLTWRRILLDFIWLMIARRICKIKTKRLEILSEGGLSREITTDNKATVLLEMVCTKISHYVIIAKWCSITAFSSSVTINPQLWVCQLSTLSSFPISRQINQRSQIKINEILNTSTREITTLTSSRKVC